MALEDDPRLARTDVAKDARSHLRRQSAALLSALAPDEMVTWVALSAGLRPVVAVVTDRRVLGLPLAGGPAASVLAPYRVEVGKKRLLGQELTVVGDGPDTLKLFLNTDDATRLTLATGSATPDLSTTAPPASPSTPSPATPTPQPPRATARPVAPGSQPTPAGPELARERSAPTGLPRSAPSPSTVPPAGVSWNWGRPITGWRDAEMMAADHMRALGVSGVSVTPSSGDGGRDVVAHGAAAQVKLHAAPTGSPDVQRLAGAGHGFSRKLFYAQAFSPAAMAEAVRVGVDLFAFTVDGLVVAASDSARSLVPGPAPAEDRNIFGRLTFEARQNRVVRWAEEVRAATQTQISNREKKGQRQLAARHQALQLMLQGLEQLADSDNPLYQQKRRDRTVDQAEKTMRAAAAQLGVYLR